MICHIIQCKNDGCFFCEIDVDLRQLKYFLVIADCGSFSQAARKLYVVQSALSHNIAQLEDDLGVPLFERHPRGVKLTKAGVLLCDYAKKVLDIVAEAKTEIGAVKTGAKEYVWLGLNHTVNQKLMPGLVKCLNEEFPNIKLGIVEDLSAVLVDYLAEGKIDLALAYNPIQDELFKTIPLLKESVCCIGSSDFLGNSSDPIKFSDVLKLPMVLPGQGQNLQGVILDPDLRQKLSDTCVMEVNSLSALLSVLEEGLGCTALSSSTINNYQGKESLIVRPIIEPEITRELSIVYRKHTKNDALLDRLANLINAYVEKTKKFSNK